MTRKAIFFTGFVVVFVILYFLILSKKENTTSIQTELVFSETPQATPTPLPFEYLTIPYLRNKTYASTIGSLTQYAQTASYTSYVTTYTSDGLTINGLLTKPNREQPINGFPGIVFVHGYIPPKSYKTTQQYAAYVDYLASNGFVVFKVDLRGHGSSEGEASGAYFSSDYVIDVLNAYTALEQTDFVNKKQIGLWGHSMAGNLVLRSAVIKKTIPAVVIWAGAVYSYADMQEFGIQDNSYQPPQNQSARLRVREQLVTIYGQPTLENPFWKKVAPISYLNDLEGAIQIHHARDDAVVSIEYSRNLDKQLNQTSVPHQLFEYQTGGHNIQGASFTSAMKETVSFYKTAFMSK